MYVPPLGWHAVSPLQYGDFLYLYENGEPGTARYAELFSRALPGCDLEASDVDAMYPWAPSILEYAILEASGYFNHDEDEDDHLEEDPPEDSIWAQHNQSTAQSARETADFDRSDLVFALHENGESYEALYALTMPEIDTLIEGAERAHERAQERDGSEESGEVSQGSGGRRDRAAQLGFR